MKQIESAYKIKNIYKDTYSIKDHGFGQESVYMYLLVGSERALLIDSGFGGLDLPAIIRRITDKPVICACTHGHVDHALGAYRFDQAYLHSADFEVYRRHSDPVTIRQFGYGGIGLPVPSFRKKSAAYAALVESIADNPEKELISLDNVDYFDLGDRKIHWKHVPGHTPGSCVFMDEDNDTVFDSDAASMGAWLFLPESSGVEEFHRSLCSYRDYLESNQVSKRYSGHSGTPLTVKQLGKLIACCGQILSGKRRGLRMHMAIGDARIVFGSGSFIFCDPEDEAFRSKKNNPQ